MRRIALLVLLAACDVGEVAPNGGVGVDGGGGGDGGGSADGGSVALACVDRGIAGTAHVHDDDNTTKAGQNCMGAACHVTGGLGPLYGAMGTVYKADGTTPNPGAVMRVAFGGMTKLAVADTAGNFVFSATLAPTFPAETDASACPAGPVKMVTKLATAVDMNCNRGGCHDLQTNRINFE